MTNQIDLNDLKRQLERIERNFAYAKTVIHNLEDLNIEHEKLKADYAVLEKNFKGLVLGHNQVLEENIKLKKQLKGEK